MSRFEEVVPLNATTKNRIRYVFLNTVLSITIKKIQDELKLMVRYQVN